MNNSNWSLKFPRTYREATGCECEFDTYNPDKWVGIIGVLALVFVLGFLAGAA